MTTRRLLQFPGIYRSTVSVVVLGILFSIFLIFPMLCAAQTSGDVVVHCTQFFTDCAIPEEVPLQFPLGYFAVAGDAVLAPSLDSNLHAVSDVFHIDHNFLDTGLGTGIALSFSSSHLATGFLFSGHNNTLPNPSTYSANAVEIRENPEGHGDTLYNGNGTIYHLGTGVVSSGGGNRASAAAKTLALDLADGPVAVAADSGAAVGRGPDQDPGQADGLAFYSTNYTSLGGVQLPFNIVGTNPANGAATTTVPTVIVPIKIVYATPTADLLPKTLDGTLDGTNVVPAIQNSPIFLTTDYTVGGTDLGVTQFGDALQRAEFHNVAGFSANYHVLLGTSTVMPTVTLTVTTTKQGNLYRLRSGALVGVVASAFLDAEIDSLVKGFTADTLPIFTTDNVFEGDDGTINTCCILGYHNSQRPPASTAKTWIYNGYTEPGTFSNNVILDVQPLSHEVSEWLNDPFVGALAIGFLNLIPPAILPGSGGGCIVNFETGDPLEFTLPAAQFTEVTNGTTYHLQDEVLLPWYLHTTPSFSVNGQYSFQNTFTSFSSLCGPG